MISLTKGPGLLPVLIEAGEEGDLIPILIGGKPIYASGDDGDAALIAALRGDDSPILERRGDRLVYDAAPAVTIESERLRWLDWRRQVWAGDDPVAHVIVLGRRGPADPVSLAVMYRDVRPRLRDSRIERRWYVMAHSYMSPGYIHTVALEPGEEPVHAYAETADIAIAYAEALAEAYRGDDYPESLPVACDGWHAERVS